MRAGDSFIHNAQNSHPVRIFFSNIEVGFDLCNVKGFLQNDLLNMLFYSKECRVVNHLRLVGEEHQQGQERVYNNYLSTANAEELKKKPV